MTKRAPTIRELDERKRERNMTPNYAALDTFMGIFGMTRVSPAVDNRGLANIELDAFGDWT